MANSKRSLKNPKTKKKVETVRDVKIVMCTDPMSCMIFDNDQDLEYDAIEEQLKTAFPEYKLTFKRNVFPHQLDNEAFDLYLFDYGGMLPGCEDMIASHYRELIKQAEEHSSGLFLLYSSFSVRWYSDLMEQESPDLKKQFNVIFYDYENKWIEDVRQAFC